MLKSPLDELLTMHDAIRYLFAQLNLKSSDYCDAMIIFKLIAFENNIK